MYAGALFVIRGGAVVPKSAHFVQYPPEAGLLTKSSINFPCHTNSTVAARVQILFMVVLYGAEENWMQGRAAEI